MLLKVHHADHLMKRKLRPFVTDAIVSFKILEAPNGWQQAFNASGTTTIRLFWMIVLTFCSSTCLYQIYDRFRYFATEPILTNIYVEKEEIVKLPGLVLSNLQTEAIQSYWPNDVDGNPAENGLVCSSPIRTAVRYSELARQNLTKSWQEVNTTKNLEMIYIDEPGSEISKVTFENNVIKESHHLEHFTWAGKYNIQGLTCVITINIPVKFGSSIFIHVKRQAHCIMQMLTTFIIDKYVPFRYMVFGRFNSVVKISPSIVQYNFAHRISHPCETDEIKARKCYENCLVQEFEKLPCRLPFMPEEVKIVDCSLISKDIVLDTYDQARGVLFYTSPGTVCNCKKACKQDILYLHTEKSTSNVENFVIIQYHLSDPYKMVFDELFVYDKIALLIDIGGNLGLFLGLSVLSIMEFFQSGGIYLHKRMRATRYLRRERVKIKSNEAMKQNVQRCTNKLMSSNVTTKKKFTLSKLLNYIIAALSALLSTYMMKENVVLYLSKPVRTIVDLYEIDILKLPNIVVCGETGRILIMRNKMSKQIGIPKCKLHFLDLMDLKGNTLSLEEMWKIRTIPIDQLQLTGILEISAIKEPRVNISKIMMHTGECHDFSFKPMPYGGDATGYILSFGFIPETDCYNGLAQLYVRPPNTEYHSMLLSQRHITPNIISRIAIRTFEVERVNASGRRCVHTEDFERCKNNCYNEKIAKALQCRLPFTPNINQSICSNVSTAKESYSTFVEIAVRTDIQMECNCSVPCKETIYQTYIYFDEPGNRHSFQYVVPYTNFIERFKEELTYSLVALLCDLGNCFGLTLGISLLTVIQSLTDVIRKSNIFATSLQK